MQELYATVLKRVKTADTFSLLRVSTTTMGERSVLLFPNNSGNNASGIKPKRAENMEPRKRKAAQSHGQTFVSKGARYGVLLARVVLIVVVLKSE